ncbi:PREDICTED: mediator of RNA polymerase II transcription subunit 11 [Cyprinodon variegatus]|uniref:mediator of RNA polymerase II transcription subunit 11 n=1 Tax=Cyprinodon variegatus TaxID=28743 RepID=UPI000742938F|nr:PREDICTED: mediator of RNA polymerase II transcription subunit 11 [Cyprinodon variegatus]
MANERLRLLEEVEKEIAVVLQCAVITFNQVDFSQQVATGQPHEGSTYSSRKDCQMSLNRAEYAKVKLGELGRTCEAMLEQQQQPQA